MIVESMISSKQFDRHRTEELKLIIKSCDFNCVRSAMVAISFYRSKANAKFYFIIAHQCYKQLQEPSCSSYFLSTCCIKSMFNILNTYFHMPITKFLYRSQREKFECIDHTDCLCYETN